MKKTFEFSDILAYKDYFANIPEEERTRPGFCYTYRVPHLLREAAWWDSRREIDPFAAQQADQLRKEALLSSRPSGEPQPDDGVDVAEWLSAKYSS